MVELLAHGDIKSELFKYSRDSISSSIIQIINSPFEDRDVAIETLGEGAP